MAFSLEKYRQLLQQIEVICQKSGRNSADITLVAATKYASVTEVNEALGAGIINIGENRVQDAFQKFSELKGTCKKHFIGHLQTNKAKVAVQLFDVIESVDRIELIKKLSIEAEKQQKFLDVLLQVNIANDDAKFGCDSNDVQMLVKKILESQQLVFKGFMAIVPYTENSEDARSWFKKMKELFDDYRTRYKTVETLSMGMSHDFQVAIEEGATEIRVGSLLFR